MKRWLVLLGLIGCGVQDTNPDAWFRTTRTLPDSSVVIQVDFQTLTVRERWCPAADVVWTPMVHAGEGVRMLRTDRCSVYLTDLMHIPEKP